MQPAIAATWASAGLIRNEMLANHAYELIDVSGWMRAVEGKWKLPTVHYGNVDTLTVRWSLRVFAQAISTEHDVGLSDAVQV
jgi:hypothetical protein